MQPHIKRRLAPFKRACTDRGIAYTTGRDLAHRGLIPIVRWGRRWYVDPADLDRLIEQHRETFPPDLSRQRVRIARVGTTSGKAGDER